MAITLIKTPEDATEDAQDAPASDASSTRPERRRARERIRAALTDERTRDACRVLVRHGAYTVGGGRIVWRRVWEERTTARYGRMMRAAEAVGNLEEAKEWEERAHRFREARHRRRMEMLTAMRQAPRAAGAVALTGAGILTAAGVALAVANEDFADLAVPFEFTVDAIRWAFIIGTVVWGLIPLLGPAIGLAALWDIGRRRQAAPHWALPASARGDGEPITPSIVVKAFRDLGISTLRKAITDMEDAGASMLSVIAPAGVGVEVDVHLPSGVSTEEIQNRRRKLAENLGRHEHEVFITIPPAARTVRLWIADSGALDEPVPASPLVTDPDLKADYKTGRCPWGVTLRGDAALVTLYQKMVLVTGLSNQGKTASLRALALWLALDPTVEFRIGDLKGIGDWHMFLGLATVLIEGPTDDHVMEVTHMVEDGFEEMQRRLLQPKGTEFHPLVIIVDEAQVAYGSGAVGVDKRPYGGQKALSRYFRAVKGIHDQGRAVNVTIWEGTQDPTDQNLPKRSREGNHIRASLVVGTESQAKMALGDAPVAKGAAPHKLRQGLDKGQLVVAGEGLKMAAGQVSENVRTHFIDDDQAEAIIERAKALRSGVATVHKLEAVQDVDHLADLALVVGAEKRVKTTEVVHRLKVRNHDLYEHWNGGTVRDLLAEYGEDTGLYDGYPVVKLESVQRALESRGKEIAEAQ
ncbi:ATP-binding protein [Streptomyces griseorubiginosus]|uniref:ATP-binding protein n=1 Tax=Streptomyces griseorubiginosus TaxID=67304 RepID=UPI0036EB56FC